MPAVKPSPIEQSRRVVRACISGNMDLYGVSEKKVAIRIRKTDSTFRNRTKEPEGFTLGELWNLQKDLKFTPIQAASIVLGRPLTSKEVKEFLML